MPTPEPRVTCAEDRVLDRPGGRVVDQRTSRKRCQLRCTRIEQRLRIRSFGEVSNGAHVDVDRVDEAPVGRVVRARAVALAGEQRVQRIDA